MLINSHQFFHVCMFLACGTLPVRLLAGCWLPAGGGGVVASEAYPRHVYSSQ